MFSLKKLAKVAVPTVLALTLSSQAFANQQDQCYAKSNLVMAAVATYQNGYTLKEAKQFFEKEFFAKNQFTDMKDILMEILAVIYQAKEPIGKNENEKQLVIQEWGKLAYEDCISQK